MDSTADDLNARIASLELKLKHTQDDLGLLIRSGRWLIWDAHVEQIDPALDPHWTFRPDYGAAALSWLPIAADAEENFDKAINRARIKEDSDACYINFRQALRDDLAGYSQEFRVMQRDGEIRWLSETVHIQRLSPTTWRLVGIGLDISDRKRNESDLDHAHCEMIAQNDELQCLQAELEAQNEELGSARDMLERQNDELHKSRLALEAHNFELTRSKDQLARQNKELESLRATLENDKVALAGGKPAS